MLETASKSAIALIFMNGSSEKCRKPEGCHTWIGDLLLAKSYSNTLSVTCYLNKITCQKKAKNKTTILVALSRRRLQRCKHHFLLCTPRLQCNLQQQPNDCKTRGWNVLSIVVETSKDPIHLDCIPFLSFCLFVKCKSYILLSQ
jgi:hypothetical protein